MGRVLRVMSKWLRLTPNPAYFHSWEEGDPSALGVPSNSLAMDAYGNIYTHYPAGKTQQANPMVFHAMPFQNFSNLAAGSSSTVTFNFTTPRPCNLEVWHGGSVLKWNHTSDSQQTIIEQLYLDNVLKKTSRLQMQHRTSLSIIERRQLITSFEEPAVAAGAHAIKSVITNSRNPGPLIDMSSGNPLIILGWPIGTTYDVVTGALV